MNGDQAGFRSRTLGLPIFWLSPAWVRTTPLGLWLRLECSLDSLSIVSTDHQIDRGLSVSLRLYEMCHVLVIV